MMPKSRIFASRRELQNVAMILLHPSADSPFDGWVASEWVTWSIKHFVNTGSLSISSTAPATMSLQMVGFTSTLAFLQASMTWIWSLFFNKMVLLSVYFNRVTENWHSCHKQPLCRIWSCNSQRVLQDSGSAWTQVYHHRKGAVQIDWIWVIFICWSIMTSNPFCRPVRNQSILKFG